MHTNELCGEINQLGSVTLFPLFRIERGDVGGLSVIKKSLSAAGNYKGD